MKRVALVIGATGQDASHMFDLLIEKGYEEIHGTIRFTSILKNNRIEHIRDKIELHYCDILDAASVISLIQKVRPTEIYNLAAISHVKVSADMENLTLQTNTIGLLNVLQAVRLLKLDKTRIYHAGTSEQFGNMTNGSTFLNEDSDKKPVSMYGIAKQAANNICDMYRDAYGMFVVCGILFNHEGPRRGYNFVTQKIARHVGFLKRSLDVRNYQGFKTDTNKKYILEMGNLNARRDWGSAKDYVEAMWMMLQQDSPKTFVVATGECHSVREFIEIAYAHIGITIVWSGSGSDEVGKSKETGDTMIVVNPKFYRDIDIECLLGDASRIKDELGWIPKTSFKELVIEMVEAGYKK